MKLAGSVAAKAGARGRWARGQVRSFALFFNDQVKQFALVVVYVFEIEFCVKLHVFEN